MNIAEALTHFGMHVVAADPGSVYCWPKSQQFEHFTFLDLCICLSSLFLRSEKQQNQSSQSNQHTDIMCTALE